MTCRAVLVGRRRRDRDGSTLRNSDRGERLRCLPLAAMGMLRGSKRRATLRYDIWSEWCRIVRIMSAQEGGKNEGIVVKFERYYFLKFAASFLTTVTTATAPLSNTNFNFEPAPSEPKT